MCEPLPGAGEWGRTRALHPCCAVAWEHSAPAKWPAARHKNSQAGHGRLAEMGRIKCQYKSRKAVAPFLTAFDDGIITCLLGVCEGQKFT